MPALQDIETRKQINGVVAAFYKKVRAHEELGPIFNTVIKDWPTHLEHITDFWATSLIRADKYKGNPVLAHQKADAQVGEKIEMKHFGEWINLWKETLYERHQGPTTQLAIRRAQNMASILFIKIYEARKKKSI